MAYLSYIPFRIKALRIDDDGLVIEHKLYTSRDEGEDVTLDSSSSTQSPLEQTVIKRVPRTEIALIAMGLVRNPIGRDRVQPSKLRQMLRGFFLGEMAKDLDIDIKPKYRERIFIDILLIDNTAYRLDASSFNYRASLGEEAGYITEENLRKLVKKLLDGLEGVKTDGSLESYLSGGKASLPVYTDVYEFQAYCLRKLKELREAEEDQNGEDQQETNAE